MKQTSATNIIDNPISIINDEPKFVIMCPWCGKYKVLAWGSGEGGTSIKCTVCGRYFVIDHGTKRANKIAPIKRE